MKNIYVLPTSKPSRLHFDDKLFLSTNPQISGEINSIVQGRNIYITNSEEIKEGDWVKLFVKHLNKEWIHKITKEDLRLYTRFNNEGVKIVLTTDGVLIKDGVQAIDNQFLEWFIDNPTREIVETFIDIMGCSLENCNGNPCVNYKVIIPKE